MTESEAIKNINTYIYAELESIPKQLLESLKLACFTLREVQQYRAIGTPEECRAAVEKQKAKKPDFEGDGYADGELVYDYAKCPICGHDFEYGINDWGCNYCSDCGQKLDWSDEE